MTISKTTSTASRTLLTLVAAALITAGCGGSTGMDIDLGDRRASGAPTKPSSTDAPAADRQQSPADPTRHRHHHQGRQVTPTNEPLQGAIGEPIVVRVNSDAADQLHVHSNPSTRSTSNRRKVNRSSSPSTCPARSTSNSTT